MTAWGRPFVGDLTDEERQILGSARWNGRSWSIKPPAASVLRRLVEEKLVIERDGILMLTLNGHRHRSATQAKARTERKERRLADTPTRSELERLATLELEAAEAARSVRSERIRHLDRAAEYATRAELLGRQASTDAEHLPAPSRDPGRGTTS